MFEIGKVIKTEEQKATVILGSSEYCEKCKICLFDEKGQRTLKVDNNIGAKIDDSVEVFIPEGMISKLSFSVFIFPIMTFLLGYWIAWVLSKSECLSIITGGIVFILAFYALWLYEKKLSQIRKTALPYISRILDDKK